MTTPADRLATELVVLDDVGPPRRSRAHRPAGLAWLWLLPTLALVGALIAWPAARTLYESALSAAGGLTIDNYRSVLRDPQLWVTLRNTGIWALGVPVLIVVLGYALAVLSRDIRLTRVRTLMLAPMALPLVVTGVAFRVLYDPSPELGPATALLQAVAGAVGVDPASVPHLLGPTLVLAALVSAFVWTWVGVAVIMFRAALDAIPHEIEDGVRAAGADPVRLLVDVQWPFLRRVAGVLVLLLAVAASRTFDLVLVMVPGSVQDEAEVLSLYVLRQSNVQQPGEAAAVSVVWLLVVVVGVLLALRWMRHEWPWPTGTPGSQRRLVTRPASPGRLGRIRPAARLLRHGLLGAALAVFAFPFLLLCLTALHRPADAAVRGWWAPLSRASFGELADAQVWAALAPTGVMALLVSAAVVVLGALAAYALAWFDLPGDAAMTAGLLGAAVVPVQVIAGLLHDVISPLQGYGTALTLGVVHVGFGLPFAVLVLRNAFGGVPADRVRRARLRLSEIGVLVRVVAPAGWRALVAVGAIEFVLVWNDVVVALLFGGPGFSPVGLVLFGQSRQFVTNANVLAASAVVISAIPLLVVLGLQRSIVTGLVGGAQRR